MNYWWVNQNQTFEQEFKGGYMWSPKTKKDGSKNHFYDNMNRVELGDIVFSFKGTKIAAIGIIRSKGYSAPKPSSFGSSGESWSDDGWRVDVEYHELVNQIKPQSHIETIRPHLPELYSPLQANGRGNQGVYLTSISGKLGEVLLKLIGDEALRLVKDVRIYELQEDVCDKIVESIQKNPTILNTEKEQLVKSRRGQGVFRAQVEKIENMCRLTKTSSSEHLIAGHIKPWSVSSNEERLDGENGFLFSPHIDHLFDKGYISFADDGTIIVSPLLDTAILSKWSINVNINVGSFTKKQKEYLAYHRDNIYKRE